jgi:hypothetical protein
MLLAILAKSASYGTYATTSLAESLPMLYFPLYTCLCYIFPYTHALPDTSLLIFGCLVYIQEHKDRQQSITHTTDRYWCHI